MTLRLKCWPRFQKTCSPSTVLVAALDKSSCFSLPQFPKLLFMHCTHSLEEGTASSFVSPMLRVVGLQSGNSSRYCLTLQVVTYTEKCPHNSEKKVEDLGKRTMEAPKVAILIKVSVAENSGGGGGRMKFSEICSVLVKFCFASFL